VNEIVTLNDKRFAIRLNSNICNRQADLTELDIMRRCPGKGKFR
jgi:hypothetical protein